MAAPLICDPAEKSSIETANGVEQLDYITGLVTFYRIENIRESHVLKLHQLAVHGVFPCGGTYRDALSRVHIGGSDHRIPEPAMVLGHVRELLDHLNDTRESQSALYRAAYALWRFNWIHPFRGGNGRTSRALTYLIVCMDMGAMLPGDVTVPSLIFKRRDDYVSALQAADKGELETGKPDLRSMESLVKDVILEQMAGAIRALGTPKSS